MADISAGDAANSGDVRMPKENSENKKGNGGKQRRQQNQPNKSGNQVSSGSGENDRSNTEAKKQGQKGNGNGRNSPRQFGRGRQSPAMTGQQSGKNHGNQPQNTHPIGSGGTNNNQYLDRQNDRREQISRTEDQQGQSQRTPPNQRRQPLNQVQGMNRGYRPNFQNRQWQRGRGGVGARLLGARTKERIDHAGLPMTGQVSDCLICCQRSDLYGLGECMHPICMECALRIRVVGECRQCPQCRTEIPMLYFVSAPPGQQLLRSLPSQTQPQLEHERKYGVRFESNYTLECFNAYMANRCGECKKRGENVQFGTFAELRSHISQAHQLSFCHICCDNLNVLIKDRRVYTREQLQQHMNGKLPGEEDGFRGHPTCQFCNQKFYDDEQQYRHLRKEHYYCQFCDQDGIEQNSFYKNQYQLNHHNRRTHHPCLDSDCLQMGICFRTDVELNVHRAKQHHRSGQSGSAGGVGNRSGAIPLGIQFAPTRGVIHRQQLSDTTEAEENAGIQGQQEQQQRSQVVRIVPSAQSQQQSVRIVRSTYPNPIQSEAEYPGLPVGAPNNALYGAPPGWTASAPHQPRLPSLQSSAPTPRSLPLNSNEQFPTLSNIGSSQSSKQQQQNKTIWGQKSNKELFAPRADGTDPSGKKSEDSKRPKFIASPECWPEHMQEKLKARELGLPDPDPIVPPHWLNQPKKEKKRKTKTVSAAAANRLAASDGLDLVPSSSKFNTLAAYDESNEENSAKDKITNWWAGGQPSKFGQMSHMKLTPSEDDPDFMRIQLPGDQQRKQQQEKQKQQQQTPPPEEGASTGNKSSYGQSMALPPGLEPPPGFAALPPYKIETAPDNWEEQTQTDANATSTSPPISPSTPPLPPASSSSSAIVHLTMRSIASALFGGGGREDDNDNDKNDGQSKGEEGK